MTVDERIAMGQAALRLMREAGLRSITVWNDGCAELSLADGHELRDAKPGGDDVVLDEYRLYRVSLPGLQVDQFLPGTFGEDGEPHVAPIMDVIPW